MYKEAPWPQVLVTEPGRHLTKGQSVHRVSSGLLTNQTTLICLSGSLNLKHNDVAIHVKEGEEEEGSMAIQCQKQTVKPDLWLLKWGIGKSREES